MRSASSAPSRTRTLCAASPRPRIGPGSWGTQRRVAARIEATRLGLDIRYVVTNIATGRAEWLYAELYCQRGQAENLIKLHKAQLASDRTSCRAATAYELRLVLHTAAEQHAVARQDAAWPERELAQQRLLQRMVRAHLHLCAQHGRHAYRSVDDRAATPWRRGRLSGRPGRGTARGVLPPTIGVARS